MVDRDFEPFHSAVNRIPVLRPSALRLADKGALPADIFSDFVAPGHDHISPERYCGSIDLEITVKTPVIYGEQKKATSSDQGPVITLPRDKDGQAFMPPTMVKGMISRAHETLTCSRFRVFGDLQNPTDQRHRNDDRNRRLTYRSDPAGALRLIPFRVTKENEDGTLEAELLRGDVMVNDDYYEGHVRYPTMFAANLQAGNVGHAQLVLPGGAAALNELAPHGQMICCKMTLCLHGDRHRGARYAYWQVTEIRDSTGSWRQVCRIKNTVTTIARFDEVTGYVYRTTRDRYEPGELFRAKHDERVFFDISDEPEVITIDDELRDSWKMAVESYQQDNVEPGKLNRFAVTEGAESLRVGSLGYAVVENAEPSSYGRTEVLSLTPIMVGRRAYPTSPADLAVDQQVAPLTKAAEASPADRLFGYVIDPDAGGQYSETADSEEKPMGGDVASRGRISFGPVSIPRDAVEEGSQKLVPLLAPKPTSARRFLTDQTGRTPKSSEGKTLARSEYFSRGRNPQYLGAAAYPVHRQLLGRSDFPRSATTPREQQVKQDNEKVRMTVRSWLKPGKTLTCTLQFTNLSKDELSALLWVLTPKNLVPWDDRNRDSEAVGYLRMGLGKPLGLGVVEVRVAQGGLRVFTGDELAEQYMELSGVRESRSQCADTSTYAFDPEMHARLGKVPWVRAMQRAAFGYADHLPVRHMSLEENKANNRTEFRTGEPKAGCGVSPADLFGAGDQPIKISEGTPAVQRQGRAYQGAFPRRRP